MNATDLPVELFDKIFKSLCTSDLAVLSLVSAHIRQIAGRRLYRRVRVESTITAELFFRTIEDPSSASFIPHIFGLTVNLGSKDLDASMGLSLGQALQKLYNLKSLVAIFKSGTIVPLIFCGSAGSGMIMREFKFKLERLDVSFECDASLVTLLASQPTLTGLGLTCRKSAKAELGKPSVPAHILPNLRAFRARSPNFPLAAEFFRDRPIERVDFVVRFPVPDDFTTVFTTTRHPVKNVFLILFRLPGSHNQDALLTLLEALNRDVPGLEELWLGFDRKPDYQLTLLEFLISLTPALAKFKTLHQLVLTRGDTQIISSQDTHNILSQYIAACPSLRHIHLKMYTSHTREYWANIGGKLEQTSLT